MFLATYGSILENRSLPSVCISLDTTILRQNHHTHTRKIYLTPLIHVQRFPPQNGRNLKLTPSSSPELLCQTQFRSIGPFQRY